MSGFSQYAAQQQDEDVIERNIYRMFLCGSQDTKGVVSRETAMCSYSPVQGAFPASFLPDWRVLWGTWCIPFVGGKQAVLAELAWDRSCPLSIFLTDGTGGRRLVRSEGWIESSPGKLLPSRSTADKWTLETDGAVCNPNYRRQIQGRGKLCLPLCQQMDRLSTYYPATRYTFNYPYLKF